MAIIHIVLLSPTPTVDAMDLNTLCEELLSLKHKCLRPENNEPYITSLTGGKDNSPEGCQNGLTYGFVVQFISKEDRDYYVNEDPAHQAFKRSVGDKLGALTVLDYEIGVF